MSDLTAEQAAQALRVSRATLYAYTSRGQIQSHPAPGRSRERLYSSEDIRRLLARQEARRDPDQAAARGLNWGSPVLASAITRIHNGRLYYRGKDAVELAATATLEDAARLLWAAGPAERLFDPGLRSALVRPLPRDPIVRMQTILPAAGAADPAAYDLRPSAVRQTGARIVRLFASAIGRNRRASIHEVLQSVWAPGNAKAAEAIRTALVLCADHELNVSTFTARCAASGGASPYDVVSAGLAALKGRRHGGETERVWALFEEAGSAARATGTVSSRLRRGERVPGFGHPLYADGDPRGALLLTLAERSGNRVALRPIRALRKAGADLLHEFANLDFGLAAMTRAYEMPQRAPLVIFALGRTVGWIAHAIEQYSSGELIRPRARYTGQ